MKKLLIISGIGILIGGCRFGEGAGSDIKSGNDPYNPGKTLAKEVPAAYDAKKGQGKFVRVIIAPALNTTMAVGGETVYNAKCVSCHKLTDEKLVGPGWKGVTKKLTAEWIMNFVTSPDNMLDKDPEAKAQLAICLVRMPNQNVSDDDARAIYEFMRKNDGVK